jgi:hypothetical protein
MKTAHSLPARLVSLSSILVKCHAALTCVHFFQMDLIVSSPAVVPEIAVAAAANAAAAGTSAESTRKRKGGSGSDGGIKRGSNGGDEKRLAAGVVAGPELPRPAALGVAPGVSPKVELTIQSVATLTVTIV